MIEWIKNLQPEDFIYLVGGLLLLVLIIIILIKVLKLSKEVAGRTLRMTEEIMTVDDVVVTNLKVVNRSYIDNEISEIGMIYRKNKVVIYEEKTRIYARNKFEHVISHQQIRDLLGIEEYKIKGIKFYYENSIGVLVRSTGRVTRNKIKRQLKAEKRAFIAAEKKAKADAKQLAKETKIREKAEAKAKRYAEGNFTAGDRIKIFFKNVWAPIKKARHNSVLKRNKKIADRRVEKEVEAERERLIEQQKLIYEQQNREARKQELEKKYQIAELKATLEEAEKNQESKVSEEPEVEVKEKKKEKRAKKQVEKKEIEDLLEDEKPEAEEKVNEPELLTVEEILSESSEDETEKE